MANKKPRQAEPEYLGDGVYVSFDGYMLRLRTEGIRGIETIYLEPSVYAALVEYVERIKKESRHE